VSAATLAALAPLPGETLWDVGAGYGSIGIEWLRAADGRLAVAIERNAARGAVIARNAASLGVPACASSPAPRLRRSMVWLARTPSSPAAGIGASGLLPLLWERLRLGGRLVANVVTAEGEARLLGWHMSHGGALTRIVVSRATPLGAHHIW
jgi:precorrin-6B C5,15-methyltransferase / cobalt-precorrin-6B C5,C15-methyltransferase